MRGACARVCVCNRETKTGAEKRGEALETASKSFSPDPSALGRGVQRRVYSLLRKSDPRVADSRAHRKVPCVFMGNDPSWKWEAACHSGRNPRFRNRAVSEPSPCRST